MTRLVRLYRSLKGTWRYEIERDDGQLHWGSLHTKNEVRARERYRRLEEGYAEAEATREESEVGRKPA